MYWQVIQFGYPQFLAIMRNGKPFVIRKNGLHEQWYSVTHLRYDIAKLLFTDVDGRDYNYLECDVELYELIVITEFKFKCRKVWFDGRLCWTMPSDAKEFPKYLAFHLRYNQMYLMFSKLRMERLDLENPQVGAGEIERPVSLKRPIQTDKGMLNKAKKPLRNELTTPKTVIEPSGKEVDGGSTSLNIPRLEPIEQQSENCSIPQEMTLESCNLLSESVRIDVLGKNDRDILRLFQENWHKIILCNGYIMTSNNNNYRYKLDLTSVSSSLDTNLARELPKLIDFYKEEKIVVFETLTKFTLYKLENNEWTGEHYDIRAITLYRRANGELVPLSNDQYTVELSIVEGIYMIYRVKEEVKCAMVKLKKSIVWRDRTNSRSFVKTLVYSFMDGSILLETNLLIKCTKVNNKWINEHQSLQQLRHCAKDGLGGFLPVYIDNVKISDKTKNIYTFDYTNVNFDLVKYYEKIIWRRQPGQPLPQSLKCYFYDGGRFYFKFKDKFIYSLLKGNELKEEHYDIPPITLLSEDNKGNTRELSSDDYNVEITTHGAVLFIYSLNPEALCTQIKFNSRVIWNRISGENKPLYIIYSQETGRIEIVFEDKIAFTKLTSPNSVVKTLEIPPELTLYKTNDQGETVQLSPLEYRIQIRNNTGLKYVVNDDVKCTELRHNGTVVWNHTDGPQPLSFIYQYRKLKRITVSYTKGTLSYELQDDQWTLTSRNNNTQSTT